MIETKMGPLEPRSAEVAADRPRTDASNRASAVFARR